VSSLDRDDVICFIADHEEALKAELRRASRSGHKAEGWQNFLRFVETVRSTAHIYKRIHIHHRPLFSRSGGTRWGALGEI
jgi:hypothetical protein